MIAAQAYAEALSTAAAILIVFAILVLLMHALKFAFASAFFGRGAIMRSVSNDCERGTGSRLVVTSQTIAHIFKSSSIGLACMSIMSLVSGQADVRQTEESLDCSICSQSTLHIRREAKRRGGSSVACGSACRALSRPLKMNQKSCCFLPSWSTPRGTLSAWLCAR